MAGARGGKVVFELAAGAAANIEAGDQLRVDAATGDNPA
jgi:hypothetical protein